MIRKYLLIILVSMLFVNARFVEFSGYAEIYTEYNVINGDTLIEPTSELRFSLNPSLDIYGMPLSLNILWSTIESDLRQAFNKFRVFMSPENLIRELVKLPNFVFSISFIEMGTCYPYYSPLTLSGVPVFGGSAEFNPLFFHMAASGGRIQRGVYGSDSSYVSYERMLYAGRFGFGEKEGTHLYLTVLYSGDDSTSIPEYAVPVESDSDTVAVITPQENYVAGLEFKLSLLSGQFVVESEVAASQFTGDIRMPKVVMHDVPDWISDITDPRISSSYDYAYLVKSYLNLLNTDIKGSVSMVGPGFTSFGLSNIRKDNFAYELGIGRDFLNSSISIYASMNREHDNLLGINNSTTSFSSYIFDIGLNFTGFPYLQVSYTPYMEDNDSIDIERRSDIITLSTGHNFTLLDMNHFLSISYIYQGYSETVDTNNYTSNSIYLNNTTNFNNPLTITGGFAFSQTEYEDKRDRIISFDIGTSYTFFGNWNNGIGFNIAYEGERGRRSGIYFNSSLSMGWFGYMNFKAERNFYTGEYESEDYDEWRLISSLSRSW